jgi:threonine dehydrogenase-like Zn-dependent dehydrogenase
MKLDIPIIAIIGKPAEHVPHVPKTGPDSIVVVTVMDTGICKTAYREIHGGYSHVLPLT